MVEHRDINANQAFQYYSESPSYLEGPLAGACHFGYTKVGERFELKSAQLSMQRLLGQMIGLPAGSNVLDAGSGYGRVADTLSREFGYNVIGVDLIQQRLNEAQKYTSDRGSSGRTNFVRGNYCALPIKDASVSAVYTMETLLHADALDDALSEFWRVLQPGGRLVLFEYSIPKRESLDPLRKKITDSMSRRTGMASIERFTHGAFPEILKDADFVEPNVEDISENVWPSWRWLFWRAVRTSPNLLSRNKVQDNTHQLASLFIWPYRHNLRYNIVTATKPLEQAESL